MEEIINKIKDNDVFKNKFFLLFQSNVIESEYDKIKYIKPKFQIFSLCSLCVTLLNFLSQFYVIHQSEESQIEKREYLLTYNYETKCVSFLISTVIGFIHYILIMDRYNLSHDSKNLKYISFLLNFMNHYFFVYNFILFENNMHFLIGIHILLEYGYILIVDSNFVYNFVLSIMMIFILGIECFRRNTFNFEIVLILIFYPIYCLIVFKIDKREKKIQYSIITMRMENERLESLLIQAHQIMVERDRRNDQAQSDLRETIETNNNIVNSVIASSVTATIQKESTSEAYFKFIS